ARAGGSELRGHRAGDGLSGRDRAIADLPRPRGDRPQIVGSFRRRPGPRRGVWMSEQEQNSQLSALFDNELSPQQAQMVIRRALKDPATRTSWERYALIGA